MKDRRGFLKLLGIGAGAAVAMVAARLAQTPAAPPRTIQDIERPIKPYIGPDGVPEGDYIKERPKVVPEIIKVPLDPVPLQLQTFDINWDDIYVDAYVALAPKNVIDTTGGTYDHNLGGYSLTNTADDHS